jgi:hypothetical protein
MILLLLPLRNAVPGVLTLAAEIVVGVAVFALLMLAFDGIEFRQLLWNRSSLSLPRRSKACEQHFRCVEYLNSSARSGARRQVRVPIFSANDIGGDLNDACHQRTRDPLSRHACRADQHDQC